MLALDPTKKRVEICVTPPGVRDFLHRAVEAGGGRVVADPAAAEALVWTGPNDPEGLRDALRRNPELRWVQLPWAGIEPYLSVLDQQRIWTAGQGVYAVEVAEHALALILGGLRDLKKRAAATHWQPPSGLSLHGKKVTVLGAGGITRELDKLLAPFGVELTVVRRRTEPFAGVRGNARVVPFAQRIRALQDADVVVLALALTDETRRCMGWAELACMQPHAWLINVARGGHVDTQALVDALQNRRIGGAALDVTDPEPLPDAHPLFSLDNCLITPHCANTPAMAVPVLSARVQENVRRYLAGEPLLGIVDVAAGY